MSVRPLCILIVASIALTAGCGGSPAAPSGPPLQPPAPGQLVCSPSITTYSLDGRSMPVTYPLPTIGGRAVEKGTCTPASGSLFAAGQTTRVTCQASEASNLVDSCAFDVTVRIPPLSSKLRLMAFGDSITEGFVACDGCLTGPGLSGPGQRFTRDRGWSPFLLIDPAAAYPTQLQMLVNLRYPTQDIQVINRGIAGELASEGRLRMRSEIDGNQPDLVLLLEGVNDIMQRTIVTPGQQVPVTSIAADLREMVAIAQGRGVDVLLATLTPVTDQRDADWPGLKSGIDRLNVEIRQIASERDLGPVVDLFGELNKDLSLIGPDGLHPTPAGYRKIAEVFLAAMAARYETVPSPAAASRLTEGSAGR